MNFIILDQLFNIDAYPKTITVTPQSKAGSKISTINFIINDSQANKSLIDLFTSTYVYTIHNNSGEQVLHYHYIRPMFHILASNTNDTVPYLSHHFQFRDIASAQCVYNSTTYLTVPFDIVLSSDSLHNLGDQFVYLVVRDFQQSYFSAMISLRVQAGMDMFMDMHAC